MQIITVEDNTDPTFTVPENTTIFTDANCEYDADPSITGMVDDESDNCSTDLTAKFADVIEPGSCAGEVVITRTWTLTDDCGNVAEQDQIITVEDNTAPTPVCLNGLLIPLEPDGERPLLQKTCLILAHPSITAVPFPLRISARRTSIVMMLAD